MAISIIDDKKFIKVTDGSALNERFSKENLSVSRKIIENSDYLEFCDNDKISLYKYGLITIPAHANIDALIELVQSYVENTSYMNATEATLADIAISVKSQKPYTNNLYEVANSYTGQRVYEKKVGNVSSVQNTEANCWKIAGLGLGIDFPTADEDIYAVSTSAADDDGSTGCRRLLVTYQSLSGAPTVTTVLMNGTTPVLIANAFRIKDIRMATTGTDKVNQGDITLGYDLVANLVTKPLGFIKAFEGVERTGYLYLSGYTNDYYLNNVQIQTNCWTKGTGGSGIVRIYGHNSNDEQTKLLLEIPVSGSFTSVTPASIDSIYANDVYVTCQGYSVTDVMDFQVTMDFIGYIIPE